LDDGGASHFVKVVKEIRAELPGSVIELLIPDLQGKKEALALILEEKPEIFSHNVETVPRLYETVRPQANYKRSLDVLAYAKEYNPEQVTKTGIMVGLGETPEEVYSVMDDLINIKCDILTIGQYLRPSKQHIELAEYVTPAQFDEYAKIGKEKGFKYVFSAPLVRSSYHAAEAYDAAREK
ncbi:MAG: lipoyl synthase, partial [Clostridiales bacterium]